MPCQDDVAEEDAHLSSYLAGTQTLLAFLFPSVRKETASTGKVDKAVALLPHGIPTAAQELQPTMDVVKPSPRFGLLLVGSTAVR
jgi:conserved oligomeric Golgi complex subunit 1